MTVRSCKACGCTQDNACEGGCWWVAPDLCSNCEGRLNAIAFPELIQIHHDKRLQLTTTVGDPPGMVHGGDANPQAFVSELIRLARLGQKVELAASATVARVEGGETATPDPGAGDMALAWLVRPGRYGCVRLPEGWKAGDALPPVLAVWDKTDLIEAGHERFVYIAGAGARQG